MANAQARGWGHPDEARYRERNIVSISAGGVRLNVHRTVARLFKGFVDELVARGYRLDVVADDWGWVNRDIRGRPGVKSNHAWGLAIDLNSTGNPMTEAHPGHAGHGGHDHRGVHTDMPAWTGELARRWGLTWGANYNGTRKDAMHFEFLGRPEDASRYPLGGEVEIASTEEDEMANYADQLNAIEENTRYLRSAAFSALQGAVLSAFESYGVEIATENEDAPRRIERIADDLAMGRYTWAKFLRSLQAIASSS